MDVIKKAILPISVSTIWIIISEFVRNEFILKSFWVNHYKSFGVEFKTEAVNGILWSLWSLIFAIVIYIISRKFSLMQTTFLSWVFGFVMMWIVMANLYVLPFGILPYSIPLSLLESFLATWIIVKLSKTK